jgi:uncharacterized protein YqeY
MKPRNGRAITTLEFKTLLKQDLKQNMLQKNKPKTNLIKQIMNEILLKEKENKPVNKNAILQKQISKREHSIQEFIKENRKDLILIETSEIDQLKEYLPKETTREDLIRIIKDICSTKNLSKIDLKLLLAEIDLLDLNVSKQMVVEEARKTLT